MENIQRIVLDVGLQGKQEIIQAKQGDKNTRIIEAEILSNGEPLVFDSDVSAVYAFRKPDKTQVINAAQISNGVTAITLSDQCLTKDGDCTCELIFRKENAVLTTATFEVHVWPNVYDDQAAISTDEYGVLIDALNAVDSAPAIMEEAEKTTAETLAVKNDLIEKRDSGFFNGAPGLQGAQGIQGPKGDKGEKGDRGDSGIQTAVDGMYTLYVNEQGHLIAQYTDSGSPPPLSIVDGHLIYNTGE